MVACIREPPPQWKHIYATQRRASGVPGVRPLLVPNKGVSSQALPYQHSLSSWFTEPEIKQWEGGAQATISISWRRRFNGPRELFAVVQSKPLNTAFYAFSTSSINL